MLLQFACSITWLLICFCFLVVLIVLPPYQDVALPLPSDDSSIASMCTVTLQARDPSVRNFTVKTADVRPFTNDKREAVFIDGWRCVCMLGLLTLC